MDRSPSGHEISVVRGDADGIRGRGREIVDLGEQMVGAAGVLRAIADGAIPQAGLSVEQIIEVIGEIDAELKLAGERYRPSGDAFVTYGDALGRVQSAMAPIVANCRTAWEEYASARGVHATAVFGEYAPIPIPVLVDPAARALEEQTRADEVRDAARAMNDAHAEFVSAATRFDAQYETWEHAFDVACESLETATRGGISDDFFDDLDGFTAELIVVLQWAGVVLAIAAFIIGGPIIAAIGAIVAIAALIATAYQYGRGDAEWWELGLAIVGVIPFGSLARFSGGAKNGAVAMLDGFTGGLGTSAGRATLKTAVTNFDDAFAVSRVFEAGRYTAFTTAMRGSSAFDDVAARIMGMGFADEAAEAARSGWGAAGLVLGHYGWVVNSPVVVSVAIADGIKGLFEDDAQTWEAQLAS